MPDSELLPGFTPDIEELVQVLKRCGPPNKLHQLELFLDAEVKNQLAAQLEITGRPFVTPPGKPDIDLIARDIELHWKLGYEAFRVRCVPKTAFPMKRISAVDTSTHAHRDEGRQWQNEHTGPVGSWGEFDTYPWPFVSEIDFSALDWLEDHLPENMGCFELTGHIFEMISFLPGFERMCMLMYTDPDLIDAMAEKVGSFYVALTEVLCDYSCVPFMWGADDMGYKSSTLVSPEFLKKKVLTWHKKCAAVAHKHGKPYLLHSCGNIEAVMSDLINDVHIDGRHSFEDSATTVTYAYKEYGDKIAIIGGIDVDFLCRATPKDIACKVRSTIDYCGTTGYCLGSGNSIANYIPKENYLAMIKAGRDYVS